MEVPGISIHGLINCKFMPEIIYELQLSDLIMDSLTVGLGVKIITV